MDKEMIGTNNYYLNQYNQQIAPDISNDNSIISNVNTDNNNKKRTLGRPHKLKI